MHVGDYMDQWVMYISTHAALRIIARCKMFEEEEEVLDNLI
jgi:hypothetical protein